MKKIVFMSLSLLFITSCITFEDSTNLSLTIDSVGNNTSSIISGTTSTDETETSTITSTPTLSTITSTEIIESTETANSAVDSTEETSLPQSSNEEQIYPGFTLPSQIPSFSTLQTNYFDDLLSGNVDKYSDGSWNKPGLKTIDGANYTMPTIAEKTNIVNVSCPASVNKSNVDSTECIQTAITNANPGDKLVVAAGDYYFISNDPVKYGNYFPHLIIHGKSNIALVGAGLDQTRFISNFAEDVNKKIYTYNGGSADSTVVLVYESNNIEIADLTVSSVETTGGVDINQSNNNTNKFKAPLNGIVFDNSSSLENVISHTNLVQRVKVELFKKNGLRLMRTRDSIVRDSIFENSVDLGGGGHGYGVVIQGQYTGGAIQDFLDTNRDSVYNEVTNCQFIGPYIRHGVLLHYRTHNNLIHQNYFKDTLLDSIDLHGGFEFSNLVTENLIENPRAGAGIGVGNSGGEANAASGANNLIYNNIITKGQGGLQIVEGTPKTIVVHNLIQQTTSYGIKINDGPDSRIVGNYFYQTTFSGNLITSSNTTGGKVYYNVGRNVNSSNVYSANGGITTGNNAII